MLTLDHGYKLNKKIIIFAVLVLFVIAYTTYEIIVWHSIKIATSFSGTVIDSKTKRPIPGVVVDIAYIEIEATPGGGSYHTLKSLQTITNIEGKFVVPEFEKPKPLSLIIYKKQYWGTFLTFSLKYNVIKHEYLPENNIKEKIIEMPMP